MVGICDGRLTRTMGRTRLECVMGLARVSRLSLVSCSLHMIHRIDSVVYKRWILQFYFNSSIEL